MSVCSEKRKIGIIGGICANDGHGVVLAVPPTLYPGIVSSSFYAMKGIINAIVIYNMSTWQNKK